MKTKPTVRESMPKWDWTDMKVTVRNVRTELPPYPDYTKPSRGQAKRFRGKWPR